ncbi:major capsid protein [Variovorax sp. PAMC26660]|uniref:major capsid protein n=1 Tax=Variovorax sp. PAMC26660 TaxID=2762322 RepID=UPI00164D8F1E|nr:major capsid protein [Variovorax sp. PAMC26660]QNK65757.1 major capsid protein [Variovorax sp. PAMC26660]
MAAEIIDIFNGDAFSALALTQGVQRNPYQPSGLGALNIFDPNPIRTTAVSVEERTGTLKLIGFSQRGAEGTQRTTEKRKMRYFDVPRLMHDDTIHTYELQNIREFPEGPTGQIVTVPMQLEREVARRLAGPTGLLNNIEYTKEYLRLAAVQGMVLDPKDGSVLYNWFDEFQQLQATEVAFNLSANVEFTLRPICNTIKRTMARKAQGAFTQQTRVYALCGDTFYDQFMTHKDVVKTFVNFEDARMIRDAAFGDAFSAFNFDNITWVNYRGSDDNSTVKIADDKVKFFPVNAPGIFQEVMAPGESAEFINQPGQPVYVLPIPDRDRRMWWKMEAYAYPLFLCTRPEVLLSGRAGS